MKSGKPKKAPKVNNPRPKDNYMRKSDSKLRSHKWKRPTRKGVKQT